MSRAVILLLALGGCGFRIDSGQAPSDGNADAPRDASGGDATPDVAIDAAIDAPIDMAPQPVTNNYPCTADAGMHDDTPNTNYGSSSSLRLDNGPNLHSALFKFNLATIPTTATITSAELHIWTDDKAGDPQPIYEVLQDWSEAQATWNARMTGMNWTTAGAEPPSRGTTTLGTLDPQATMTEYTISLPTALVGKWVATPTTNFGIILRGTGMSSSTVATREYSTAANRPFLRVTYTP